MGILHLANELRLLRCTFVASVPREIVQSARREGGNELQWGDCLQTLVDLIEAGEYFQALASPGVAALLGSSTQEADDRETKAWFSAQKLRIKALVSNQVNYYPSAKLNFRLRIQARHRLILNSELAGCSNRSGRGG